MLSFITIDRVNSRLQLFGSYWKGSTCLNMTGSSPRPWFFLAKCSYNTSDGEIDEGIRMGDQSLYIFESCGISIVYSGRCGYCLPYLVEESCSTDGSVESESTTLKHKDGRHDKAD